MTASTSTSGSPQLAIGESDKLDTLRITVLSAEMRPVESDASLNVDEVGPEASCECSLDAEGICAVDGRGGELTVSGFVDACGVDDLAVVTEGEAFVAWYTADFGEDNSLAIRSLVSTSCGIIVGRTAIVGGVISCTASVCSVVGCAAIGSGVVVVVIIAGIVVVATVVLRDISSDISVGTSIGVTIGVIVVVLAVSILWDINIAVVVVLWHVGVNNTNPIAKVAPSKSSKVPRVNGHGRGHSEEVENRNSLHDDDERTFKPGGMRETNEVREYGNEGWAGHREANRI